jgi:hypothetical protein
VRDDLDALAAQSTLAGLARACAFRGRGDPWIRQRSSVCSSGFGGVFGAMVMEGGQPGRDHLPPALVLIFVGTFGACMASNTLPARSGRSSGCSTA